MKEIKKEKKKFNLTDKQKLIIKISAAALYFAVLVLFIVLNMSYTYDVNGVRIVEFNNTLWNTRIHFYALSIMTGMGVAYFYSMSLAPKIGVNPNNLFDGFIYGAILGILGARIYYAIFEWNSGGFADDPLKVITGFFSQQGGLAIHGAVIAAAIFAYFFSKKRNEDLISIGELLFPGFLIGQIFGRWGNFFNKEAHGGPIRATAQASRQFLEKLPIPKFVIDQMYINGTYMHPTFLYESVWNLIGLIFILIFRKKSKKYWYGDAILFYLVWYGIGRYFVESLRTDALLFEIFGVTFRTAQVISIAMIIAGVTLFALRRIFKYKPLSFLDLMEQNKDFKQRLEEAKEQAA